ncbi:ubiquinone biosynthesis methyltransferase UbiE [Streptomyces sp. CB00455]|uniref:class I SAM-dependent methyltransferase n=1 Tax=Streptomyces sp. CB00455 TaxID=1703927 RepID=UPI00093A7660|nr:class I SAM-dependent methyltransferase [Streptomyces sp. CB00455]OKK21935.1 ubiquinone biosynthesis methyltransferase UbiE [Streptomyces sp. CB00455]
MSVLRHDALSAAFDHAATRYDLMVAASPGYHGHLRRSARRLGLPDEGRGAHVLDLGCGTGASTAAVLAAARRARVTGVDASPGMLERAAAKDWPPGVDFTRACADRLADAGVHGPFDAVFAAYLLRNVPDPDRTLASVREVMAPGARIAVHEYTLGGRRVDRALWTAVCKSVIMPLGRVGGDAGLYEHLWRSVLDFDTAGAFAARMRRAGFVDVRVLPLPGWQWGITHTFVARAPGAAA